MSALRFSDLNLPADMTNKERDVAMQFYPLWRATRCENVVKNGYTDWMTLLVEVLNGNKDARNIYFTFHLREDGTFDFAYLDDGDGCSIQEAKSRLLEWAAANSVNGDSIYGHGTKAFLAKSGDYDLNWTIRSRAKGANSNALNVWSGPYMGQHTRTDTADDRDGKFPRHGFEILLKELNRQALLGKYQEPADILTALREIICVRKSQRILDRITFHLTVIGEDGVHNVMDSKHWLSLHEYIRRSQNTMLRLERDVALVPEKCGLRFSSYKVPGQKGDGGDPAFHKALKELFPIYGNFSGASAARIHQFNEDTMIEATPYSEIYSKRTHSTMYNFIEFAEFYVIGDRNEALRAFPQPATTKVQYQKDLPVYKEFLKYLNDWHNLNEYKVSDKGTEDVADTGLEVEFTLFANTRLAPREAHFIEQGKEVTKPEIPQWMSGEGEYLVADGDVPGTYEIETYRERTKGLRDDVLRAHSVLQYVANEKQLSPQNIRMKYTYILKKPSDQRERVEELKKIQDSMLLSVYPFRDSIEFVAAAS